MSTAKKEKKQKKGSKKKNLAVKPQIQLDSTAAEESAGGKSEKKLKTKAFDKEMAKLHVELVKLQEWVKLKGLKVCIVFEGRIDDGRKIWKLSPMDVQSYTRWDDYTKARDEMFAASDTSWAPWFVAKSEDKKSVRLNIISHLLSQIPYKKVPHEKVDLPQRKDLGKKYKAADYPFKYIPEAF